LDPVEFDFCQFIGEIDRIRWKSFGFQNPDLDESIEFHQISINLLKDERMFLPNYTVYSFFIVVISFLCYV
jgi:hypothetical protein